MTATIKGEIKMIKMIIADMDGTSLNEKEDITKGSINMIEKVLDSGRMFFFASGRPVFGIKRKIRDAGLEGRIKYFIAYNGGVVYDVMNEKHLYEKNISFDIINSVYEIINKKDLDVCLCLHHNDTIYVTKDAEEIRTEAESNHQKMIYLENLESIKDIKFMKILLIAENKKLKNASEELRKSPIGNEIKMMFSLDMLLEILPHDSDKSVALRWLADYLNISLEDILAVGDAENDIEMLKEAGIGVAMSNAYEHVKEIADYVTEHSNNEDGLVEAVEKFVSL